MLDFSCHTWGFTDLTLPEALGTMARLGFRYVDIGSGANFNAARAAANPRKAALEIRADLDLFDLQVSDVYLLLPRISSADERRQRELDLYHALVPFAVELGTPGITLSPGLPQPDDETGAVERAAAALRDMVAQGTDAGLRVSIEPHLDSLAATPEAALQLVNDVPGLALTVDWAHLVCQGIPHETILTLLPHAQHIQLRQAARGRLQTPFEQGEIDLPRVVADMLAAGYDGRLCVEVLQTPGWHGLIAVNSMRECARLRDELRAARDKIKA